MKNEYEKWHKALSLQAAFRMITFKRLNCVSLLRNSTNATLGVSVNKLTPTLVLKLAYACCISIHTHKENIHVGRKVNKY